MSMAGAGFSLSASFLALAARGGEGERFEVGGAQILSSARVSLKTMA